MTTEEVKLHRLSRQHLLRPVSTQSAIRDLCGVQAQYLSHALHGLSLRCGEVDTGGLIKSWTLRGTMHLFAADDLPLMLHEGRSHFLRDVDTLHTDAYADEKRKAHFAACILDSVARGNNTREALKEICRAGGMTEGEEKSLFDPWGGIIRALCEEGYICHKVQQEKAYALCPAFTPLDRDCARLELLRRYFHHFGPASVSDAACFFGWTQGDIRALLPRLAVESVSIAGRTMFHIPGPEPVADLPRCIFLAGFDQLMLGYRKTENPFLPAAHLGDIFTRSGIVRPAVLVDGTVKGYWNLKNRRLLIQTFEPLEQGPIREVAENMWRDLKQIEFA